VRVVSTPSIVVGPLLRYVDAHRATVWVETDRACQVEVLGHRERTWSVHGHHYALVRIAGLEAGTETGYGVALDGAPVWPEPSSPYPPSVIRTFSGDDTFRLAFGSCRRAAPMDSAGLRQFGVDALVALAERMARAPYERWPDALFLAGDQVYADEPSDDVRRRLREAHRTGREADDEVREEIGTFEQYTWLYSESWTPAPVRWLLSTVPTCMLLDDHDLRDDWNTSLSWRQWVTAQPWWRDRVTGAFASYWVYQHLGNLSPEQLDDDPTYAMVLAAADDDERSRQLEEFAWRSDTEPDSARWSFYRDFGNEHMGVRMLAVDSRCARNLDPENRAMVDTAEWAWLVEKATTPAADQRIDHLLIGTTLPFLLLHGIHHLEGWDEAVSGGAWGQRAQVLGERVRQAADLEHWSAFRRSFHDVLDLLQRVARAGQAPASVLLLSGDVHCSYTAQAALPGVDPRRTAVHQLTMSPFRNPLHIPIRIANRALKTRGARTLMHALARAAGVRDVPVDWEVEHGPWFDNGVMTVVLQGRRAAVEVEHAVLDGGDQVLRRTLTLPLTRS
jgi:hypothetical protein